MPLRTTTIVATAAAATSIALLAGCGGSASEATTSTATSTTAVRKAAPLAASRPACLPNCANADLRGVTLSGPDLVRADFSGADLSDAKIYPGPFLFRTNFTGANLYSTRSVLRRIASPVARARWRSNSRTEPVEISRIRRSPK